MALPYLTVYNGSGSGYKYPNAYYPIVANTIEGYTFTRWAGTLSVLSPTSRSTSVWIGSVSGYVQAYFAINYYSYTYSAGPGGQIVGPSSQSVAYHHDGELVEAVPNAGYHFTAWSDGDTNPHKQPINVESSKSYTAYFEADEDPGDPHYTLTVNSGSGDGSYVAGIAVEIVADAPAVGYHFTHWSGDIAGISDVYASSTTIFTQAANAAITANYAEDNPGPFTLTYTAGSHGSISGDTPQTVAKNNNGSIVTAVPDDSYAFQAWSDGVLTASRQELDVIADISVTANFVMLENTNFPQIRIF